MCSARKDLEEVLTRKLGILSGKTELTFMMNAAIADALSVRAKEDRRTQSACLDLFVETYLSSRELPPLPEGGRLQRNMIGKGETKIRKYAVEPKTVRLLEEAETLGYSQSYIVEESVKEGLANASA